MLITIFLCYVYESAGNILKEIFNNLEQLRCVINTSVVTDHNEQSSNYTDPKTEPIEDDDKMFLTSLQNDCTIAGVQTTPVAASEKCSVSWSSDKYVQ